MKAKALLTAILLATTNFAWAQGGLSIENVEQHMNAGNWADTQTPRSKIVAQGPIDKFDVETPRSNFVDTDALKHSRDDQA